MKRKPIYIHILIRLAFLIIPLFCIYLLMVFTYDPHEYCVGDYHRHTMGPVGYFIMGGLVGIFWFVVVLIELIWRYFNKDKKVLWMLFVLAALGFLAVMLFQ